MVINVQVKFIRPNADRCNLVSERQISKPLNEAVNKMRNNTTK